MIIYNHSNNPQQTATICSISEFIDTIADSWKQYLNNGDENVYDLMNDRALFKVPATLVPKTDMELLFEVLEY